MKCLELDEIARGAVLRHKDGRITVVCDFEHFTGRPMVPKNFAILDDLDNWEVLIPGDDCSLIGTPKDEALNQDIWLAQNLPSVDPTEKARKLNVLNDPMYD